MKYKIEEIPQEVGMLQPVAPSEFGTWIQLKNIKTFDTKVKSVACDQIVSEHIETEEGDFCDKQLELYRLEQLRALDNSIYSYALSTFEYAVWPVKIMSDVLYACCGVIGQGVKICVDLSTPRGTTGRVLSTAGWFLGFYFSLTSSSLVCGALIAMTMKKLCIYRGDGYWTEKIALAGAPVLFGIPLQVIFVNACAEAGGYALVIIHNCIYKLVADNPEEKKLIEQWKEVQLKIKDEKGEQTELIKDELEEEIWDINSNENALIL